MKSKQKKRKRRGNSFFLLLFLIIAVVLSIRILSSGQSFYGGNVPQEVIELGKHNPDAKDFVKHYQEYYGTHQTIDLSKEAKREKFRSCSSGISGGVMRSMVPALWESPAVVQPACQWR